MMVNVLIIQIEKTYFLCGKSHKKQNPVIDQSGVSEPSHCTNLRNVNKPKCFSALCRPGPRGTSKWDCLPPYSLPTPSLSLSLTWPHNPADALIDSFQNNPWEAHSCSEQQQVRCRTKKRRQMDRQTDENGWMKDPNWPCLPSIANTTAIQEYEKENKRAPTVLYLNMFTLLSLYTSIKAYIRMAYVALHVVSNLIHESKSIKNIHFFSSHFPSMDLMN